MTTTTAARRITREVNSTTHDLMIWFDEDGQVLTHWPTGTYTTVPEGGYVRLGGTRGSRRGKLTEAQVQAVLDARVESDDPMDYLAVLALEGAL